MIFYADSSFLTSLYLVDSNYPAAKRLMRDLDPKLPLTEFGTFELSNAIRATVFRGALTVSAAEAILR